MVEQTNKNTTTVKQKRRGYQKREVNEDTKDRPCRSTNDHRPLGLFSILYGLTPNSIPEIQLNRSDNFYIRPEPIHPTHSRPQPRRSPGGDKGNPSGVTSTLTIFSHVCFQIYTLCTRQRFRRFALARRSGVTVTQSSIACIQRRWMISRYDIEILAFYRGRGMPWPGCCWCIWCGIPGPPWCCCCCCCIWGLGPP